MNDVGLIQTVLDLTGLGLLNSLGNIGGHGAGLGRGHQALGAQHLTEAANHAHHVRAGDDHIEIKPVFLLNLLNQIHIAHIVGAGLAGGIGLVGLGKHQHADSLAGAMGQHDSAADLLVSVTGVNAQLHVKLNGLVKLGLRGLADEVHTLSGFILSALVDQLGALLIFLASKQCYFLLIVVLRNVSSHCIERSVTARLSC